jgi:hypothetical protein
MKTEKAFSNEYSYLINTLYLDMYTTDKDSTEFTNLSLPSFKFYLPFIWSRVENPKSLVVVAHCPSLDNMFSHCCQRIRSKYILSTSFWRKIFFFSKKNTSIEFTKPLCVLEGIQMSDNLASRHLLTKPTGTTCH